MWSPDESVQLGIEAVPSTPGTSLNVPGRQTQFAVARRSGVVAVQLIQLIEFAANDRDARLFDAQPKTEQLIIRVGIHVGFGARGKPENVSLPARRPQQAGGRDSERRRNTICQTRTPHQGRCLELTRPEARQASLVPMRSDVLSHIQGPSSELDP
jgi:hypothetical protein